MATLTSKFLAASTSSEVGADETLRAEAVEKLSMWLLLEGAGLYWVEEKVSQYEAGGLVYLWKGWQESPIVVSLLVHEFIHFLQYEHGRLLAYIEGDELVIPDIDYRCDRAPWEEELLLQGYTNPEIDIDGYETIEHALSMEVPAFLLQDSYEWFIKWYEDWCESRLEED